MDTLSFNDWQICLAVSQARLANDTFRVELTERITPLPHQDCELSAASSGYRIHVLDAGQDLIEIQLDNQATT